MKAYLVNDLSVNEDEKAETVTAIMSYRMLLKYMRVSGFDMKDVASYLNGLKLGQMGYYDHPQELNRTMNVIRTEDEDNRDLRLLTRAGLLDWEKNLRELAEGYSFNYKSDLES